METKNLTVFRRSIVIVTQALLMLLATSCRTPEEGGAPESNLKPSIKATEPKSDLRIFELSKQKVKEEKDISFSKEFRSFKSAIAAYRRSVPYKTPRNDEERALKTIVDNADLLPEELARKLIKESQFSEYDRRVRTKLPQYAAAADQVFTDPIEPRLGLAGTSRRDIQGQSASEEQNQPAKERKNLSYFRGQEFP